MKRREKPMKILFKNASVVSGRSCKNADILIEGEKILKVAPELDDHAEATIDLTGKLVFPGFIDAHTHFDLEVAGTVTADDFYTGTQAALAGGTTTVIDFATQNRGETLEEALANWHKKADDKSSCDYAFHMAISDWNEQTSRDLPKMLEAGISTFKLYMTYDAMMLNDHALYQALKRIREVGGIAGVHCENSDVIRALVEEKRAAKENRVACHPETRPACLEAEAVSRLLTIAKLADTPVIIVHLTNRQALWNIKEAREQGQTVYAETCPQYLLMEDSVYYLPDFEGARYVIAPPLRKPEDQESLWKAVARNEIQTIATDHCSFTLKQKELGLQDFTKIPGGMPGVETRAILLYTYGVKENRITLEQMCRLLAENPARLYGMYPRKGVIAPGSDADLVILDPQFEGRIRAEQQLQNVDYAPFEGMKVKGRIETVYLRGTKVMENGGIVKPLTGTYIARKQSML